LLDDVHPRDGHLTNPEIHSSFPTPAKDGCKTAPGDAVAKMLNCYITIKLEKFLS
jgi:hypothetical protein